MKKTILAIGGHIGDACLTAGGVMASNAVEGGKNYTLALTAGEKGSEYCYDLYAFDCANV